MLNVLIVAVFVDTFVKETLPPVCFFCCPCAYKCTSIIFIPV